MGTSEYLYSLNYPEFEKELCGLEVKALFNDTLKDKVFFSNAKVDPSVSPFLQNRLEVMFCHASFAELALLVERGELDATDFMVCYVKLYDEDPPFQMRRSLCRQLGFVIHGNPLYASPKDIFGVTLYKGMWYFGRLMQSDITWKEHKNKPHSYSSSIGMDVAKVLVNLAGNGDVSKRIVDPCCGVGTVLLEGIFAGYAMKGWEINRKIAEAARGNLAHFGYSAQVMTGDMKDIDEVFDAAIIDLPYGNFSITTQDELQSILKNAKRISSRIILVSAKDISEEIEKEKLVILDRCQVGKKENGEFVRHVWVTIS